MSRNTENDYDKLEAYFKSHPEARIKFESYHGRTLSEYYSQYSYKNDIVVRIVLDEGLPMSILD
jgi:hypothetical protein